MSTLIEKLEREYQKWCELEDKSEFGSGEAIDARGRTRGLLSAIQVVKQHSDWISVNERLPEHDKPVLVWVVSKAGNAYAFKSYYENSWHLYFGEVTHWQPLPQPPSEVQP